MKLPLQTLRPHPLPLRKRRQRQRQDRITRHQNQPQIHRRRPPRIPPKPPPLQPHQHQRRQDHNRTAIQHPAHRRLAHRQRRRLAAPPQALDVALLLGVRRHREHVDARAHLLAAHEQHVEEAGRGDGREGDQAAEDEFCGRRHAGEARDEGIEAHGDGAGRANGEGVGLGDFGPGEGGGFIGVGRVDGDVEGLVGDLPGDGSAGLLGRRGGVSWDYAGWE